MKSLIDQHKHPASRISSKDTGSGMDSPPQTPNQEESGRMPSDSSLMRRNGLIEKIKISISEMISGSEKPIRTNFSNYLSQRLRYNYTYLANIFSKGQGITIEHYIILSKIERAKELIILGKLNLTEISYLLHYSSVAHLSNQFKKVTGSSPSAFKRIVTKR